MAKAQAGRGPDDGCGMDLGTGLLRLLCAVLAGAAIGFERELNDKPAGLRTNILICFGAALFTILSLAFMDVANADGARIAAQIVTGVGFLGAGTIVHFKGNVLGLTTAATIWAVASIGMAFGAGQLLLGMFSTLITASVLFGLAFAEELISSWRVTTRFKIKIDPSLEAAMEIKSQIQKLGIPIRTWMITNVDQAMTLRISVVAPSHKLEKLQHLLIENEHVRSLRRV